MKDNIKHNETTFLAKWIAGEMSNQDLKQMVSDDDYNAYLKLKKGIEISEALDTSTDSMFYKIQQKINSTPKFNKKSKVRTLYTNWLTGIAASVLVLFGLLNYFSDNNITQQTGFGEHKTLTLLDGSEVVLNAKSTITYNEDNWGDERTLYLEGEAYFKVAKGKTFTVMTNNGSVKVLGTQFNVNSTEDFFDVLCFEGKVEVDTKKSTQILLPNDAVRKINGHQPQAFNSELSKPTWITGESSFKSVPLRYIIKAIENQYNITIDATDVNTSEIFTGGFPHKDLNTTLKTVFHTFNITYKEKEKRNIKLRYK